MSWLSRILQESLAKAGLRLHRIPRGQVIPPELPGRELYVGPEYFGRLFRPWLGREYDRWFTPPVLQNTMLPRQKLYFLRKLLRQTLSLEGDILEAGVGSGGSARLMLDCLRDANVHKRMWLLDTFAGYQKV